MSYPREGTSRDDSGDDPDDGYSSYGIKISEDLDQLSVVGNVFSDDFSDEELTTAELCIDCGGDRETCVHIKRPTTTEQG